MVALWRARPRRWALVGILAAFVVVLAAWLTIPPSNERDWQPDVATLAFADIHGDRVIVHKELDLSKLRFLDFFLVHWGSPFIAHTIMGWGFEGDQYRTVRSLRRAPRRRHRRAAPGDGRDAGGRMSDSPRQ